MGLGRLALEEADVVRARASFGEALSAAREACLPYLLVPSLCGLAAAVIVDDRTTAESLLGEARRS